MAANKTNAIAEYMLMEYSICDIPYFAAQPFTSIILLQRRTRQLHGRGPRMTFIRPQARPAITWYGIDLQKEAGPRTVPSPPSTNLILPTPGPR